MRVIDSYNGCGFYAVGADSAKSAASAASAAKYIDGADLASKDYVAYNYVKLSAYNSDMAPSNMSSKVETCMQYSTWLPATYYRKTDTSSKDELSAAFANVTGGGGGEYVPLSATACSIGNNNTATAPQSFSQGVNNKGLGTESFTQGNGNSAYNGAFAQGRKCYASNYSIAQGSDCSALEPPGQAFGQGTVISSVGMVIGQYNKTSANVAFVIGDGVASNRSDLFVIDKWGNVSAKSGYFYDKDGKVGGGGGGSKVDSTARLCIIGNNNTASLSSVSSDATFVQGVENSAYGFSFAQGYKNLVSGTYVDYLDKTKTATFNFAQGYTNTAYNYGMAQGKSNLAYIGFAQGTSNTASSYSISIGNLNKAINDSISIGIRNTACYNSLAIGSNNTANSGTWTGPGVTGTLTGGGFSLGYKNNTEAFSFGLGQSNYASGFSISLGYNCTAKDYSQSFGLYNVITDYGMVIGKYNKTSANAAFVIGNGDSTANRSDLFVIDKTGIASGKDFYSENGAKLDLLYKLCSAISSHSTGKFNLILNNGDIEVEEIS